MVHLNHEFINHFHFCCTAYFPRSASCKRLIHAPQWPAVIFSFLVLSIRYLSSSLQFCSPTLPSCCGAGTAADTERTTDLLSSNLSIFSLNSGRNPRVVMAVNILQDMLYRFVLHTHMCAELNIKGRVCLK